MKTLNHILLSFIALMIYMQPVHSEVVVIANPNVASHQLSASQLSRIYAMQIKTWPNGQPIKVFTFAPQSKEYKDFVINKARIQPHQLDRHWKRLLFTGTGRIPVEVPNADVMLREVRKTPGAIGYLEQATRTTGVKVIEVGEKQ